MPFRTRKQKPYLKYQKFIKVFFGIIVALGVGIIGIIVLIWFKPAFSANFADNILRPTIGNQATIVVENFFFGLSDSVKQLEYHTIAKPSGNIYTVEKISKAPNYATLGPESWSLSTLESLDLTTVGLHQLTFPSLTGEGAWSLIDLPQFRSQPVMARTFVRPDPNRSYAIVALVQMNSRFLQLHAVAGTQQPGGPIGHYGPGKIAESDQNSSQLVAAFNGGFQYKDGKYGMIVGQNTYVPLQENLATLSIYDNANPTISRYIPGSSASADILALRQNGPLIVDKGQVTQDTLTGGYSVWGLTTTSSSFTWRSGIGITSSGNLVYAVGPSLSAETLAVSLKAAGAIEAMQLDINSFWVRFVMYQPKSTGGYDYQSLLTAMQNGGYNYLHGYNKDFFYLTMKN
ncbi:MAG: phosphodiester glycosidase family protein [Candidatus Saccharimonadia bacterium]